MNSFLPFRTLSGDARLAQVFLAVVSKACLVLAAVYCNVPTDVPIYVPTEVPTEAQCMSTRCV